MARIVSLPPGTGLRADGTLPGGWWHDPEDGSGRIVCDLCPRDCHLKPGDRGFCFVRQNVDGEMVLTTYGRSTGFCIDPIEKKPLNHFYPGTSVLSFGTAGCNLGCQFCQNWDISKSREIERLSAEAAPETIAEAARAYGCKSVAFTYNDPVIWAEYAIDTARACHDRGLKTVAVTAGYITPAARGPFYEVMDAANVDLKAFSEEFYRKVTYSHLQPVLDTLAWLKAETDVWFEITNLVIPRANDDPGEMRRMCGWILEHCGDSVPLHLTAFHPDFRMRDREHTPVETLVRAYEIARGEGLKFVYVGNIPDAESQDTYCPHCSRLVIERNVYELGAYHLDGDGRCGHCGGVVPGRYAAEGPGTWGRRRQPVDLARFARPAPKLVPAPEPARPAEPPEPARPVVPADAAPELSEAQRLAIRSAAGEFVRAAVEGRAARLDDPSLAGAAGLNVLGAYITLRRQGHLRGCCGFVGQTTRLIDAVRVAALRTATDDVRFPTFSTTELPYLDLQVNLLHGLTPVESRGLDRLDAVEVGRHGLRIGRGSAVGLLLPSVAVEGGWDAATFLRQVCRKAGLPTTAWQDEETALWTFRSITFGGPLAGTVGEGLAPVDPPARLAPDELAALAEHARGNVLALARGLAPEYYRAGLPDGNVAGLALSVAGPGQNGPLHAVQMVLRGGVPLQATLFALCEALAPALRDNAGPAPVEPLRVGVTVLEDPAPHGTYADADLRGINPARRALVLIGGARSAWAYDPSASPGALLERARHALDVRVPETAGVYSLAAQSTEPCVIIDTAPRPVTNVSGARPPAVAGRFYPGDAAALSQLVDRLLAASSRQPRPHRAALVPHAGLIYSGQLAAAVFNRIRLPDRILILGPKHTSLGVDWAVSPHESWAIPGSTVPGDPELARALVEAIPGLRLDAAAHQREHAIEVELPLLARLAPTARVVGIAVGSGDLDHCRAFARGLADVVGRLEEPPLLVISSDMNHFATDAENRRLDAIALEAIDRLDPADLLATVREHNISMCGVLPAVIVMETLRLLGGLNSCQRVGYTTSAEVSGDASRVVGYAGLLLD